MYLTKYLIIKQLNRQNSLLVNTLSGAIDVIDNHLLPQLTHPEHLNDTAFITKLKQRGYLYDNPEQEKELLQNLYQRYAGCGIPPVFVVCPTHSCNLRCRYCFESQLVSKSTEMMQLHDVDLLFQSFKKIDARTKQLQLFGGEPLLPATYPVIEKIFSRAQALDYHIDIITNGVNIKYYNNLIKKYKNLIGSFQITLDGPKEVHDRRRFFASGQGTFERIMASVGLLIEADFKVSVRVNVDAENIDYLPELTDIFAERGWLDRPNLHFALAPVNDHKGTLDRTFMLSEDAVAQKYFALRRRHGNLRRINHQLFRLLDHIITVLSPEEDRPALPRFKYCESNSGECFAFGADGYIYACSEAIGDRALAVGVYRPHLEMWSDKLAVWNNRSILTMAKCRDCRVATFCGGGCAYAALCQNGDQNEPVCQDAEQIVNRYLESIKEDFLKKAA